MLLTKNSEVILNNKNIKWYENRGYHIPRYKDKKGRFSVKRGTTIKVKTQDITKGSHITVDVECDYCKIIASLSYKDYIKGHDDELGDCCQKCRPIKHKKTMQERYGVDNPFELKEVVEKAKETNRKKYGVDWGLQNKDIRQKINRTMIKKYGTIHPLQVEEFLHKNIATKCKNRTNPTSVPQLKLYKILLSMYKDCDLEVPCDRCSLDCVININGIKIDVEYDGWYYHQDHYRDRRRDGFVKSQGYKILRVKGNKKDELPTELQIKESVNHLLSGYTYMEIKM